jgi:phosphoenolpyruvate carboxylase
MDDPQQTADKDEPLRYDVRLLGRILGETVRVQEGDQVFESVERIRQTALRFHRQADTTARHELQTIISGLAEDQAIRIIRAFGYFSHLANIAEDQHHIRRTRVPWRALATRACRGRRFKGFSPPRCAARS